VIPVVKAEAYGHGAGPVARRLAGEGVRTMAVAVREEGEALRGVGIETEILLLNASDPEDAARFRAFGLTPTLYDLEQARGFAEATSSWRDPLTVELKFDTGMGRLGFRPEELAPLLDLLARARGLRVAGCFTNFASAENPADPSADRQADRMREMVETLRTSGVRPSRVHLANSAGVLTGRAPWADAVRPGIALYGVLPDAALCPPELEIADRWEADVCSVRSLPAGTPLGYGGSYRTPRAATIAVLPIGYHDGYRRAFSGRMSVLIRGERAPVVGAISMDLTLVDVTATGARIGDRAVLLGEQGGERVSVYELAGAAETIPYEIMCGIGPRVARVYEDGKGRAS
jgi:alanine racemase